MVYLLALDVFIINVSFLLDLKSEQVENKVKLLKKVSYRHKT